jgi:hypothetical protein
MSNLWVRSPDAPKITNEHGSGVRTEAAALPAFISELRNASPRKGEVEWRTLKEAG